jgi:hypothetical protein
MRRCYKTASDDSHNTCVMKFSVMAMLRQQGRYSFGAVHRAGILNRAVGNYRHASPYGYSFQ